MKNYIAIFTFYLVFSCSALFTEEPMIDLRTFIKERTQQYIFYGAEKIVVNTAPRTGSTLIYNVLRFLFERDNPQPFSNQDENLVIKRHDASLFDPRYIYVSTIRNPVECCISNYRLRYNETKSLDSHSSLGRSIDSQIAHYNYLDALRKKGLLCLILRYEDFVNDFEPLFRNIENHFGIVIDPKDRALLKKALSKENVNRNIAHMSSFSEYDQYSSFHGAHIDKGEISELDLIQIKRAILVRLCRNADLFKKWGYPIRTDSYPELSTFPNIRPVY
jgi:hypothetical protein